MIREGEGGHNQVTRGCSWCINQGGEGEQLQLKRLPLLVTPGSFPLHVISNMPTPLRGPEPDQYHDSGTLWYILTMRVYFSGCSPTPP